MTQLHQQEVALKTLARDAQYLQGAIERTREKLRAAEAVVEILRKALQREEATLDDNEQAQQQLRVDIAAPDELVKEKTKEFWRCFHLVIHADDTTALETEAEQLLDELRPFVDEGRLSKRKFRRTAAAFQAGIEEASDQQYRNAMSAAEDGDEDDEEPLEEFLAVMDKPKKGKGGKEKKPWGKGDGGKRGHSRRSKGGRKNRNWDNEY